MKKSETVVKFSFIQFFAREKIHSVLTFNLKLISLANLVLFRTLALMFPRMFIFFKLQPTITEFYSLSLHNNDDVAARNDLGEGGDEWEFTFFFLKAF